MNRYLERSAIPSSYVHLLYDYLAERGLDGEPALGQKRPATSARPGRFPVFEWSQLLQCAARQLDDPLLGLHLGQSISPRHLGIMGYVILACGNLGAALERLEHYQRLIYDVNPMHRQFDRDYVTLSWGSEMGRPGPLVDETAIVALLQFCRNMCNQPRLSPQRVDFINPRPQDIAPYEEWFGCEVNFDQSATRLVFPMAVLEQTLDSANPDLAAVLEAQAQELLKQLPDENTSGLLGEVMQLIQQTLPTGRCSAEEVAARLHLSPRHLQRKLHAEGSSFRELLRASREQLARHYLDDPQLQLSEIAALLGYSEQSAFTRSFRQWTTLTPTDYRRKRG